MELGEGGLSPDHIDPDVGEQQSAPNINDVLQAIEAADPSFREQAVEGVPAAVAPGAMFGGSVLTGAGGGTTAPPPLQQQDMYINIVEQPASKALRFRYECEGRSAGSIPGARSTAENKTYPTIEIVGYRGRAVVVVSCITKDKPYKAHPHNLVGKDNCRDGVCTMQVNPDTMTATFSNLGIQCVKKRDIEEALRIRESIRVDPFKMGFSHKSQPSSIDLNAVRLCFQVFLEQDGKFKVALPPVVSEVIYDKKAMSELTICRMSHCAASVAGGQEVILLCEKVAKEDITVNLFELSEDGSKVVWSADGESILVHKQVAIAFRTPRYSLIQVDRSIHAYIQLKRPSDGATSDSRPFELTPVHSHTGRPSFYRKRNADLNIFSLLADSTKTDGNNNQQSKSELASAEISDVSPGADSCSVNISDTSATIESVSNGNVGEDLRESLTSDPSSVERETAPGEILPETEVAPTERTLNDLLDQVAELDEIYSENRTRLKNVSALNSDQADVDMEDFDDAGTYTSLQLAFKNPVPIAEPDISYEDVHTYRGPIIEFSPLKKEEDVPPLPPKRIRKAPSVETMKLNHTSVESLLKPGKQLPLSRSRPDLSVSEPALPPEPPKKRSFLSRLFRRRNRSPPAAPTERRTDEPRAKPVGRSVSSVSGQRPSKFKVAVSHTSLKDNASGTGLSYADSVTHISLHGDDNPPSASASTRSLRPSPPLGDDTILVAETVLALSASDFKKLQEDLDLTEAENYALYMAVAPHATVSEFDETSCYYSPVDGTKFQQQQS